MTIRAEAEDRFLLKYLIISLIAIAFGFWATYDGFVKYPGKLPRAKAWQEIQAKTDLSDAEKDAEYKERAEQNNWPSKRPSADESVKKIEDTIIWQYIFMALGFGVGVPLLVWYLRSKGTWIALENESTIVSSWGQQVEFKQIEKFDKKKWDKKGIGVVHYNDGGLKTFVIDDLKYQRKPTDEIVRIMERSIGHDKIINGLPEPVAVNQLPGKSSAEGETESANQDG